MNRWRALGTRWPAQRADPVVGDIIALDYAAWKITEIWPKDDKTVYRVNLELAHGTHHLSESTIKCSSFQFRTLDIYPSGRVPLCSCCGNPAPCRIAVAERVASEVMEVTEKRMARAGIPGICYACGEVISSRQGSITYPADEGNIQLPGYPSPRFHTRRECSDARYSYAKDRAKVMPDHLAFDDIYAHEERRAL